MLLTLTGTVVYGKAKGRTVGMPTANLRVPVGTALPESGVYATTVRIGEERFYGVTHVGSRPSVDKSRSITVETLVLDYSGDLYGRTISVDFYKYLRGTQKFNSLEEVKRQVDADCQMAREFFGRQGLD